MNRRDSRNWKDVRGEAVRDGLINERTVKRERKIMTRQQRDSRILTWLCVIMAVAVIVALIAEGR